MLKTLDKEFCKKIREMVADGMTSHLEAVAEYAKKHNLDMDLVPDMMDQDLLDAIEIEATNLNLLKRKPGRLPFED